MAIGRLKEAAATEQALKRAQDASLARTAQLDEREKKVQALEARAKVVKRKLRGSKKADAARRTEKEEVRRRERALAVEQKRVRRRARDAEERRVTHGPSAHTVTFGKFDPRRLEISAIATWPLASPYCARSASTSARSSRMSAALGSSLTLASLTMLRAL